ncbi:uncharacterized protein LOC128883374 isoform X2 [Hylaeus volcanicus]|uniref:uncharacterized protein LOC128883374 isoform X2 n=1 Tax=Hylaeus volcanicus TaxID=313075 RepID=UPI0023B86460|nr:uncharacterized protein LOC128883374 isoform X2 [Hylaeus volcanicus]
MRVDRVSAGLPFSPKRLQSTTLTNEEPTLLASLYGTSFNRSYEKRVQTMSAKVAEKSFYGNSNAAEYNVEKTQPLIFCSSDLHTKQNDSYRFPCNTSNAINPSCNVTRHKISTKQLPLSQLYTKTLDTQWQNKPDAIKFEYFDKNQCHLLKKSNHVTRDPGFTESSRKMKEQINQLRRSYFRFALELSKLCTKWYRHTLKKYFGIFYSELKRINKTNLSSQVTKKSSCCLRHIGNRRLMASVLFKNLMILILSPKKLKLIGFCRLIKHSIKSLPCSHESCTSVSNFEAFQIERGVQCMQRVLLRVCFKKFQSTCVVTWREIRPLIQQVTHLVQRHLESDRSCDTVTSSVSTNQTSKVVCDSIHENRTYSGSDLLFPRSNDKKILVNENVDQNTFDIPVMVCAKSLSTCETFPYTLSSESIKKLSTELVKNEQLVTDVSFTSHSHDFQSLPTAQDITKEENQPEAIGYSKEGETKTPHFFASCQSTQQTTMTYENFYLNEMCQGDYFVKYHRKSGKPSWRYIWVDPGEGTLCWRSFKTSSTPVKNNLPPQQETNLRRKTSQRLSRFFFPFTTKEKTSGTLTSCDLNRIPSESSICLQRSQSTLTTSTKIQSKPSFLGVEPQYVFLSKLKKISYSWIYKPNKAASLIRKHSPSFPYTCHCSPQPCFHPMTSLTFLLVLYGDPPRSRSFNSKFRKFSLLGKNHPSPTQHILQFTCVNPEQLYTWLIGLHILMISHHVIYPSIYLHRSFQQGLNILYNQTTISTHETILLKRFLVLLRWDRLRRFVRHLNVISAHR